MPEQNSQPSIYPADSASLTGLFRLFMTKFLQNTDDMLPAVVVAYDRTTNRAQVQPFIKMITTQDQLVSRAQLATVPVFQFGAGGFIISNNLKPGDLGWIKANDRDISVFLQHYKESGPPTLRKHTFEDAVFFPDPMTGYTIDPTDSDNLVIQKLDGSVKISLGTDTVTITAPHIKFVSTTLTHNNVNIGDTHVHGGVVPGGGNTAGPH